MADLILYFFIGLSALSAMILLFIKNVFKAALCFLVCLLGVAGIYVLSFAEFVAVTQILIYAGGITVVLIFGIMLTTRLSGKPLLAETNNPFSGFFLGALVFALIAYSVTKYIIIGSLEPMASDKIPAIGISLMTSHSLPFELAGIILLVSLVGAAVVTSFLKTKKTP